MYFIISVSLGGFETSHQTKQPHRFIYSRQHTLRSTHCSANKSIHLIYPSAPYTSRDATGKALVQTYSELKAACSGFNFLWVINPRHVQSMQVVCIPGFGRAFLHLLPSNCGHLMTEPKFFIDRDSWVLILSSILSYGSSVIRSFPAKMLI
jgi:hypothetical protein